MSETCCAGCGEPTLEPTVWRTRTFCHPCLRIFQDEFAGFEFYVRRRLGIQHPNRRTT